METEGYTKHGDRILVSDLISVSLYVLRSVAEPKLYVTLSNVIR